MKDETRKVYIVTDLFFSRRIEEADATNESGDWTTIRVWDGSGFGFYRAGDFFFDKDEALRFAKTALRCYTTLLHREALARRDSIRWAEELEHKTDDYIRNRLCP